jgi:hypothetical protein
MICPFHHRKGGHRHAMLGFERRSKRGVTPLGAAPAIRPRGGCEDGSQGAHQPGHENDQPHSY